MVRSWVGVLPNIPRSAARSWPFGQRVSATIGGLAHDGDRAAHEPSNPPPPRWLASQSARCWECQPARRSPKVRERGVTRLRQPSLGRRNASGIAPGLRQTGPYDARSEEHTSELQSLRHLVCRLLLEK